MWNAFGQNSPVKCFQSLARPKKVFDLTRPGKSFMSNRPARASGPEETLLLPCMIFYFIKEFSAERGSVYTEKIIYWVFPHVGKPNLKLFLKRARVPIPSWIWSRKRALQKQTRVQRPGPGSANSSAPRLNRLGPKPLQSKQNSNMQCVQP